MRSSRRGNDEGKKQPEKAYVDYHPQALEELIESAQFYELRQEGLGARFLDAIAGALKAVSKCPLAWKPDESGRRKYRVWKFPYVLIYKAMGSHVYILAVAHMSRRPGYWQNRKTE